MTRSATTARPRAAVPSGAACAALLSSVPGVTVTPVCLAVGNRKGLTGWRVTAPCGDALTLRVVRLRHLTRLILSEGVTALARPTY